MIYISLQREEVISAHTDTQTHAHTIPTQGKFSACRETLCYTQSICKAFVGKCYLLLSKQGKQDGLVVTALDWEFRGFCSSPVSLLLPDAWPCANPFPWLCASVFPPILCLVYLGYKLFRTEIVCFYVFVQHLAPWRHYCNITITRTILFYIKHRQEP